MSLISFETKIKINLHKTYFDVGFGMTQYFKYLLLLFGAVSYLASWNLNYTLYIGIAYAFGCYIIGWFWLNTDFYKAQFEVSNRYNPFVEEMRKTNGIRHKKVR